MKKDLADVFGNLGRALALVARPAHDKGRHAFRSATILISSTLESQGQGCASVTASPLISWKLAHSHELQKAHKETRIYVLRHWDRCSFETYRKET